LRERAQKKGSSGIERRVVFAAEKED